MSSEVKPNDPCLLVEFVAFSLHAVLSPAAKEVVSCLARPLYWGHHFQDLVSSVSFCFALLRSVGG